MSAHGNKIISFPRLGGLHHRYTVAAQDFKVRDSALTKTIYLESAKDALSVRPEPANLLTRSCQIQTQVCSLNNHGNTRLENTQFLSFGEAQRR